MTEAIEPRLGRSPAGRLSPRLVGAIGGTDKFVAQGFKSVGDAGPISPDVSNRPRLLLGRSALIAAALLVPTPSVIAASEDAPSNHGHDRVVSHYASAVTLGKVALPKSSDSFDQEHSVATEQQWFQGLICDGRKPKVLRNNRTMKLYCSSSVEYMPFWRQCKQGDVPACRTFMAETRVWSRRAEDGAGRAWRTIRPVINWLRDEAAEVISTN